MAAVDAPLTAPAGSPGADPPLPACESKGWHSNRRSRASLVTGTLQTALSRRIHGLSPVRRISSGDLPGPTLYHYTPLTCVWALVYGLNSLRMLAFFELETLILSKQLSSIKKRPKPPAFGSFELHCAASAASALMAACSTGAICFTSFHLRTAASRFQGRIWLRKGTI